MSILHYENWDGVTAPTIPSGWNIQSGSGIVTASSGPTPISSPNMVTLPGNSTPTDYAAIWNTADGVSGNVTVQGTGLFVGNLGVSAFSVFGRGSSATNPFGGNCYEAQVAGTGGTAGSLIFSKYISGSQTQLTTVSIPTLSLNVWYQVTMVLNATSHNISLQRLSDSYWLSFAGTWVSALTTAISESDSALTSSGYAGWSAVAGGSAAVYGDDWTLTALSAPAVPPNDPIVVHFPFQYYPGYYE